MLEIVAGIVLNRWSLKLAPIFYTKSGYSKTDYLFPLLMKTTTLEMKAVIKPSQCSAIDEAIRQETL
ncbi:MAG: hypothetical protein GPJ20_25155 [Microcystis aeruginosa BS13-10]|jgi:hypothetical protein|nr:hypothetical protein [Microcystis aeruginosa G13-09]NCS41940.1 hypothetical protein [Microcystis aeruginosa BS13-10]